MSDKPGPLLRLWGIKRAQLPPHPPTPQTLTPFLTSLLSEALPFIASISPSSSPSRPPPSKWKPKSTKSFPTSTSPVRLLERRIPSSVLSTIPSKPAGVVVGVVRDETWACRVSLHEDRPADGTASWAEFRHAMKEAHAESEREFTPTVVAARRALEWDCASITEVEVGREGDGKTEREKWGKFSLVVEEMRHRLGKGLKDRVFPVLQMTASRMDGETGEEKREFVVVSVTVSDFGQASEAELTKKGDVVVASYVSVERVRKVEGTEGGEGKIEWLMATASDAGGVLPMWVQTKAVPGQIAKDVGLFLGWVKEERKRRGDWDGQTVFEVGKKEKFETSVAREEAALRRQQGYSRAGAGLT